jgi:hypothetical protein
MPAIRSFRHLIMYPAMMQGIERELRGARRGLCVSKGRQSRPLSGDGVGLLVLDRRRAYRA